MQSVNFYFEEYRPKPLTFDSRFASLALAVSVVMLIILSTIKSTHLSQQEAILANKKAEKSRVEAELIALKKQMAQNNQLESLDVQILTQQKSLTSYRKILANMQQPDPASKTLYSHILAQLGEQKTAKIWLTQINIKAQNLTLQGSALETDAIPHYVALLKDSSALKRQFDELKVERDEDNSRIVNFSLTNGKLTGTSDYGQ